GACPVTLWIGRGCLKPRCWTPSCTRSWKRPLPNCRLTCALSLSGATWKGYPPQRPRTWWASPKPMSRYGCTAPACGFAKACPPTLQANPPPPPPGATAHEPDTPSALPGDLCPPHRLYGRGSL